VSEALGEKIQDRIKRILKPSRKRTEELEAIFNSEGTLTFADVWPNLNVLNTWTGGSCGISLNSVLRLFPKNTFVIDPGYLSSEVRGSITMEPSNQSGILTFQFNYFEFVERNEWESGRQNFVSMHQLKEQREYYVFVTTPSGLFRYHMNDVVLVKGYYNTCPLISFVQKGIGVCNITGEKLYEGQVLQALDQMKLSLKYVQVLANETTCSYECYMEWADRSSQSKKDVSDQLDDFICQQNIEYAEKRKSNRLKPIEVKFMRKGAYDKVKEMCVAKGQNDSQFKTILLQYKSKFPFDLNQFVN
jgi:hypothetical protein